MNGIFMGNIARFLELFKTKHIIRIGDDKLKVIREMGGKRNMIHRIEFNLSWIS